MDDSRQEVTVRFTVPVTQPGTPQAHRHGCLCRFETNIQAGFLSAERADGHVIVVIHEDCPMHEIVRAPMDDAM
ncbi:MAG: hypothetical protein M3R63_08575 [Actinomycetota bacterium]|nr:hypothetical protein [Actinomycetota bacterium]